MELYDERIYVRMQPLVDKPALGHAAHSGLASATLFP